MARVLRLLEGVALAPLYGRSWGHDAGGTGNFLCSRAQKAEFSYFSVLRVIFPSIDSQVPEMTYSMGILELFAMAWNPKTKEPRRPTETTKPSVSSRCIVPELRKPYLRKHLLKTEQSVLPKKDHSITQQQKDFRPKDECLLYECWIAV